VPILIVSQDGGRSWRNANPQPPLHLTNARIGRTGTVTWIQSYGILGDGPTTVMLARDGVPGWIVRSTPCTNGQFGQVLAAADATHLWLECGEQPANSHMQIKHLYRSLDGGVSWSAGSEPGTGGMVGGLVAPGAATLVATAQCGTVARSSDGGLTWTTVIADTGGDGCEGPTRLAFPDALHGWTTGGARVYRTSDGGLHWTVTVLGRSTAE
jgi:hypothetical protein